MNPTPALVENAGLDTPDQYVAAMKRVQQHRAWLYQFEHHTAPTRAAGASGRDVWRWLLKETC